MAQSSASKGPRPQVTNNTLKSRSAKENQTQPTNSLMKSLNSKATQLRPATAKNVKGSWPLQASQAQDVDAAERAALLKKVATQQG